MTGFIYWNIRRPLKMLPHHIAKIMPRWLVYYCMLRLISHATTGPYGAQLVSDLTAMDAIDRWSKVNK